MRRLVRSEVMARIRGKDTRPEILLRRAIWAGGGRYRVHHRICGVRPDLVFPNRHLAVFVDGCFWHGCPSHYVRPRTNSAFWNAKLHTNFDRDHRQTRRLVDSGWLVIRLFEHEVEQDVAGCARIVLSATEATATARLQADWRLVSVKLDLSDPSAPLEVQALSPLLAQAPEQLRRRLAKPLVSGR